MQRQIISVIFFYIIPIKRLQWGYWLLLPIPRTSNNMSVLLTGTCSSDWGKHKKIYKTDLQALYLHGTYCHKIETRPPSCNMPLEPTISTPENLKTGSSVKYTNKKTTQLLYLQKMPKYAQFTKDPGSKFTEFNF